MKENGSKVQILETDVGCRYGQTGVDMRGIGETTELMEEAVSFMQMVTYMKEIGLMIKPMDSASTNTSMGLNMKGTGRKTNNMDMVEKYGLMVPPLREIM